MGDSTILSHEDCERILQRASKNSQFNLTSYDIKPLSDTPIGFLGDHYLLTMNSINNKHSFFVKTMPNVKTHSDYINDIGVFKKEVSLFEDLMPKLQEATDFLENPWSPKCHLARENLLVFENLSTKNYRLALGRGIFDLKHCILAIETLADFHASSLIFEHINNYKINEKYPSEVKETTYIQEKEHPRDKWLSSAINALMFLCKKIDRKDDAKLIPNIIRSAVADVGPSSLSCNVLSHGDLWANNFMFCYDANDDVRHCILVDFQLTRYAPCALDLICCIHLVTSRDIRNQYLNQLINVYYKRLSDVLKQGGLNIDKYLTIEQLLKECIKYKQTAIAEACLFGISIWLPGDYIEEALGSASKCQELITGDRSPLVGRAFSEDEFFQTQLTDLLNELLDSN